MLTEVKNIGNIGLVDDNRYKCASETEVSRLLSVITSTRDLAIFTLAYNHALRASEVGLILYPDDVDIQQQQIRIKRLKGGLARVHPLNDEETKLLKKWIGIRGIYDGPLFVSRQMRAISRRMLDMLMKRYGEKANLPKDTCHFHVLRHSCASHMVAADIHQVKIQKWLGHRDIASTLIYAEVADLRQTGKEFFDSKGQRVFKKDGEDEETGIKPKRSNSTGGVAEKRIAGKINWRKDKGGV